MSGYELLGKFRDNDGTEKKVHKTPNGIIEITDVMNKRHKKAQVLCVPTHHYCNLGCKFCHLTEENDNTLRMQPISSEDLINVLHITSKKVLLSFMGVGEPLLNVNLIIETYKKLQPNYTVNLALATMMPVINPLKALIEESLPLKIHFSLHSTLDETRSRIIPSAKLSILECLQELANYRTIVQIRHSIIENMQKFHQTDSPIEIHYTIIENINDSDAELHRLIEYGDMFKIPLKILKFNPTKSLKRSSREQYWLKVLKSKYKASVRFYDPPGANIGSSCGQFTKHYYITNESKRDSDEFEDWRQKYQVVE